MAPGARGLRKKIEAERRSSRWSPPYSPWMEAGGDWLLYGANGYTGRLILEEATIRGHRPVLAGRNPDRLRPLAERARLPWVACDLDDAAGLDRALADVQLVVHAAGPFVETSEPMIAACLRAGVSYLDISGEIPVFERALARHEEALERGVLVMPGVGFDVVPLDCLAAYVVGQLQEPRELELAHFSTSGASRGTVLSALGILQEGGKVRRGGRLESRPFGRGGKTIRMWRGEGHGTLRRLRAIPAPMPELVAAWKTTGVENITTYLTLPRHRAWPVELFGPSLPGVLGHHAVSEHLRRRVERSELRPKNDHRAQAWARARNERGALAEAWLDLPEPYSFTASSAVRAVEACFALRPKGVKTPAGAFGEDLVLRVPSVERHFESGAARRWEPARDGCSNR